MPRGISLVTAVLVVSFGLVACAEEEKPIEVPAQVRDGVTALLTAADPAASATFDGETCNTDPLADPPDDHRWRMTAAVDATDDEMHATALKLGWQPERAEDGTLLLVNAHQFGEESVQLVVRDGAVTMLVEQDCTGSEMTDRDYVADGTPELTGRQGGRLEDMVRVLDDAVAAIEEDLEFRQREDVYYGDPRTGRYLSCAAGDRSGAWWRHNDMLYGEATSDDDLGPAADRVVEATGWQVVKRVEDTDDYGRRSLDLDLKSPDGDVELWVGLSFWGTPEAPDGLRLKVSGAKTTCVAVDTA